MENQTDIQRDIQSLNIQYLMLARHVAQENPKEAAIRFGIDANTLETIRDMDLMQIKNICTNSMTIFAIRAKHFVKSQLVSSSQSELAQLAAMVSSSNINKGDN